MSGTSSRLAIPYTQNSDAISGYPTISQALAGRLDLNPAGADFIQAGVLISTDWSFTAKVNGSTCAMSSEASVGGAAWLPDPVVSGGLVRSQTTSVAISSLTPATKPASGKYMTIGFELTESEGKAVVSIVSGAEFATQAEAESHTPATTTGKMRIRDVAVKNTAGVYSIVKQRDRRPWARGFKGAVNNVAAEIGEAEKWKAISGYTVRAELSGKLPLLITLSSLVAFNASSQRLEFRVTVIRPEGSLVLNLVNSAPLRE